MTPGQGCTLSPDPMTPSTLSFTRTGNAQCGQANIIVNNGTSPFQLEVIPENHQQKTIHFVTNMISFVLDLPEGSNYFIAITDSDGNSGVEGLFTVGASSDSSCLKAAATVSVGKATAVYSGSGVLMPSTSSSTTSQPTVSAISDNRAAQSSSNVPIIAGVVGGVVLLAAITLLVCWCLRRRRRQRAIPQPEHQGINPQMVNIPPYGYAVPHPNTQYPQSNVAQGYAGGYSVGAPHAHQDVTMHAPRPQSYPSGQSILLTIPPSSTQQSPSSNLFSHSTGMSPPLSGKGGYVPYEAPPSSDMSERAASSLPPGAMSPTPRDSASPLGDSSVIEPLNSPGSDGWVSGSRSPIPRSDTETVPPPYREQPSRAHFLR